MTQAAISEATSLEDLTRALLRARRGFRSDVAALIDPLKRASLQIALAARMDERALGVSQPVSESLTLRPHLLPGGEGEFLVALFTDADKARRLAQVLGWTTEGDSLDLCELPGPVALDLALELIDERKVIGLLLNPGDESELFLRRTEVGSLLQGRAIPLVGYVEQIPIAVDETTLISELDGPVAESLREIVQEWAQRGGFESFELCQTWNAERDLEPHLTLRVKLGNAPPPVGEEAHRRLLGPLFTALRDQLPPPGYIDVLFG